MFGDQIRDKKPWTILFTYTKHDDSGKKFRATCKFITNAIDIPRAYKEADALCEVLEDVSLGAILPGHHPKL